MKSYKRLVAGTLALTLLLGAASCSKKTEETQQTEDTTITISTDVPSSDPVESTPQITNENGEYLVDGETFEERYGSQLHSYLNHQYYMVMKQQLVLLYLLYIHHTIYSMKNLE